MLNYFDTLLFRFINQGGKNIALDFLMVFANDLVDNRFLLIIALALLLYKDREKKKLGILLLAALTLEHYIIYYLKIFFARPRPFMVLPNVNLLLGAGGYSFPSGHATLAFTVATLLSSHFKKHTFFFALASLAGLARIYIGVHYPIDVLAGATLGAIVGYVFVRISCAIDSERKVVKP